VLALPSDGLLPPPAGPPFPTVVFATDFSAAADAARVWALGLARRHGSRLLLVHALAQARAEVRPEEAADALRRLEAEVPAAARAGLAVEAKVLAGSPPLQIAQFARRERADLIVMGSDGTDTLGYPLVGPTAERMARYAPCALLVVRVPARAVADCPGGGCNGERPARAALAR
jgi:nucleotide-binding universal stress UspA family protein